MEPVDINPEIAITKTGTLQNWVHHPSECKCILVNFQISTCAADICKWANLVIGYRGIQEGEIQQRKPGKQQFGPYQVVQGG